MRDMCFVRSGGRWDFTNFKKLNFSALNYLNRSKVISQLPLSLHPADERSTPTAPL